MAKSPDKKKKPTAKDAQRQREDDILKRMLDTPPTPHKAGGTHKPVPKRKRESK